MRVLTVSRELGGGECWRETYGFLPRVVEHFWVDVVGLALDLVCPTTIVSYGANNSTKVATSHVNGLAVIERLDGCQKVCVLLKQVGQLQQHATPLVGCCLLPRALEGLAGGRDCNVNILLGTFADLADDLLGRRVDDIELLLVGALDPLAVNVPEGTNLLLASVECQTGGRVVAGHWGTYSPMGCLYVPVTGVLSSANKDMLLDMWCSILLWCCSLWEWWGVSSVGTAVKRCVARRIGYQKEYGTGRWGGRRSQGRPAADERNNHGDGTGWRGEPRARRHGNQQRERGCGEPLRLGIRTVESNTMELSTV